MAQKLAAGNWKMNGTGADLAEVARLIADHPAPSCTILLCPPATLLSRMAAVAAGRIALGGQDCHVSPAGAHTGDIAAAMLAEAGASHVILGHSERRADHGETDATVAAKAAAALAAGLVPVICLGDRRRARRGADTCDHRATARRLAAAGRRRDAAGHRL
jgi:triosephosphate isomerase